MNETKKKNNQSDSEFQWPFGTKNYIVFAISVIVIAVGYILLGQGSITMAPILLVIGYCVLIPMALIIRDNKNSEISESPNK
ncbi:MAG: hypothetical protein DRP35_06540 [Candidatus Zixiibacteriota bacterium]|nr:MAG: hypothetical protein DRP35_06540 [candidate division Zixibacteria bacterium]